MQSPLPFRPSLLLLQGKTARLLGRNHLPSRRQIKRPPRPFHMRSAHTGRSSDPHAVPVRHKQRTALWNIYRSPLIRNVRGRKDHTQAGQRNHLVRIERIVELAHIRKCQRRTIHKKFAVPRSLYLSTRITLRFSNAQRSLAISKRTLFNRSRSRRRNRPSKKNRNIGRRFNP